MIPIDIDWDSQWKELKKKYGEKAVKEAQEKTACGCLVCTAIILNGGTSWHFLIKGDNKK